MLAIDCLSHANPAPETMLAACVAALGRTSVNLRAGVFNYNDCIALMHHGSTRVAAAPDAQRPLP